MANLCTTPHVGPVTASAFVAAVDTPERFDNAHQVESYFGLVPSEMSSGEKQRKGRITKAGNARVRWLLVQHHLLIQFEDAIPDDTVEPGCAIPTSQHGDQEYAEVVVALVAGDTKTDARDFIDALEVL